LNGEYYSGPTNPPLNVFPDLFVAERSFWIMLNATRNVSVYPGCHLVSVAREGTCLTQADFLCANDQLAVSVQASIFIDASYDADIVVAAGGIDYAHGREPQSAFNESLAGLNFLDESNESFDRQNLSVGALFPNGSLIPGVLPGPFPPAGSGDDSLMAFSYFACVSDQPNNSVPYPQPAGYDPSDYALLQRQIEGVMSNGMYPNGPDLSYFSEFHAYDTNQSTKLLLCCGVGPVNCDEPGLNAGWATANYSERLRIAADHKRYLLGSLYYMANDPRVPNYTQYAVGRWGLCRDEYTAFGNWPPQIYVRVSNRLQGEVVLTQNTLANPRSKPDGVSMGCWEFDQHTMSRRAIPDPSNASRLIARNEGYFRNDLTAPHLSCSDPAADCTAEGNWYDVPFAAMLPRRGQASNLLVPVCISASSVAYTSTRIEGGCLTVVWSCLRNVCTVCASCCRNVHGPWHCCWRRSCACSRASGRCAARSSRSMPGGPSTGYQCDCGAGDPGRHISSAGAWAHRQWQWHRAFLLN
jgi:hypothetical protein